MKEIMAYKKKHTTSGDVFCEALTAAHKETSEPLRHSTHTPIFTFIFIFEKYLFSIVRNLDHNPNRQQQQQNQPSTFAAEKNALMTDNAVFVCVARNLAEID